MLAGVGMFIYSMFFYSKKSLSAQQGQSNYDQKNYYTEKKENFKKILKKCFY